MKRSTTDKFVIQLLYRNYNCVRIIVNVIVLLSKQFTTMCKNLGQLVAVEIT